MGKEEIKKPLYRAMLLMLIADYMSDRMESTDWVVKTEEDFQDAFGYNSHAYMGCFHMGTEYRNIFDVAMNDDWNGGPRNGQIMWVGNNQNFQDPFRWGNLKLNDW